MKTRGNETEKQIKSQEYLLFPSRLLCVNNIEPIRELRVLRAKKH